MVVDSDIRLYGHQRNGLPWMGNFGIKKTNRQPKLINSLKYTRHILSSHAQGDHLIAFLWILHILQPKFINFQLFVFFLHNKSHPKKLLSLFVNLPTNPGDPLTINLIHGLLIIESNQIIIIGKNPQWKTMDF